MEGKKTRPFSSSSTQEQSPNDALQVSDQFSSLLQTNFDLDSPAFSHSDHSFAFQQQQPQTKASLSTPEAYWSASSNFSSAPELTLSSSEAHDQSSFFDSVNRPYTPSYNSVNEFEGAYSEQNGYWSGAGSHLGEVDFDFGLEVAKGQANSAPIDYDPETADNYNNLDAALLAAQSFTPSQQPSAQQARLGPEAAHTDQQSFREPLEKSPFASPLLGATSPAHTRHSSFGSNVASPAPALDNEQTWMQSLGQRMSLQEETPAQRQSLPNAHQQSYQHLAGQQPFFAPVFEEEVAEEHRQFRPDQQQSQYPSYTYRQPSGSEYDQQPEIPRQAGGPSQLPILSISDTAMHDDGGAGAQADGRQWPGDNGWSHGQVGYFGSSYSNTAQATLADLNSGGAPPPSSTRLDTQLGTGERGPKRQDSYDPIRKFLRLDVDMGFVSQQQHEQHQPQSDEDYTSNTMRKRSNSDFGPAYFGVKEGEVVASSPLFTVVPGGVTDKTPTALVSGVDWVTEAARQRKLQAQVGLAQSMQQNGHTMDPHLLQKQQQQQLQMSHRLDPASGPIRQRDSINSRGTLSPYQHNRASSSGASNSTPWTPLSPTPPGPFPAAYEGAHPTPPPPSRSPGMRRPSSASRHRRGAQSEDLSQLARSSNPTEFLHRITAPDGSLAPPHPVPISSMSGGAVGSVPAYAGSFGTASTGAMNSYRNPGFDREQSSGSMRSKTSSAGSVEPQDGQHNALQQPSQSRYESLRSPSALHAQSVAQLGQRVYSQTALPTYSSLSTPADSNSITAPAPQASYPVVQVTTSATQAASASRRKNDAIHICPIPGCGSTFTRKFNLNGHIRSHTGARPYECKEPGCGKSFARSFDLSRHEKLHAGIKPHNCESCGKAFARADALSRHLRNDAGNGGCAVRFLDGEEDDSHMSQSASTPAPRYRHGSSASSSLDSQDELDRTRDIRQEKGSHAVKREHRFKGYIL